MAKIEITRTELVWPGKYDEHGGRLSPPRVNLPFQIIETVNESRATREARKQPAQTSLFDYWGGDEGETLEEGWRNKLIWGDNLLVMSSLMEKFAGKIDLAYIDPPFATGVDFSVTSAVGESGQDATKVQSLIEEKAYRDTWGRGLDSYLTMMAPRLQAIRTLLSPTGSLFVHCDWHVSYLLRSVLDDAFGAGRFVNEIVWYYYNKLQGNVNHFASNHDVILWYSASETPWFTPLKEKRAEGTVKQIRRAWDKETARLVNVKGEDGKVLYQETDEKSVDDVWRISMLQPADKTQNVGYPTQKPEALLERIITACSQPDALVADFFVGSGTTAAVAEKLGRRWIAADLGRFAIHTTRKRLMGVEGCKPFEVMNLGKYERQYWQTSSFGGRDPQQVVFEYLAFILKLYGAAPVAGMQHIHGKKGGTLVHVGSVDAPVTIDEVIASIDEVVATGQKELHVLGWEWEMGLNDTIDQLAVERGVRMKLLAIPREVMEAQAVEQGDIRFFELAHLDCSIDLQTKRQAVATLSGFALSEADGIDQDVLAKIEQWSDFVDYWAIDWDFRNDTFVNGWVAYRTRRERRLTLVSDAHIYEATGAYRIAVKVVDIFGNDTTKVFPVEVR